MDVGQARFACARKYLDSQAHGLGTVLPTSMKKNSRNVRGFSSSAPSTTTMRPRKPDATTPTPAEPRRDHLDGNERSQTHESDNVGVLIPRGDCIDLQTLDRSISQIDAGVCDPNCAMEKLHLRARDCDNAVKMATTRRASRNGRGAAEAGLHGQAR
jgi:hypothetical protein